jgi:hypothetical protein
VLLITLGYRSLHQFREPFVEETTEDAVDAGRRPQDRPMFADAIGSSTLAT